MSYFDEERMLEQSLQRFNEIQALHAQNSANLAQRVNFLYRIAFIGLALVLGGLFFLILVISNQMNHMNRTITTMNTHFDGMNGEMNRMLTAVAQMDTHMVGMVDIVRRMDAINGSVEGMADDMLTISDHLFVMNGDVDRLHFQVRDMRDSLGVMDSNMGFLTRDIQHLSRPMQLFNQFNPFW